MQQIISDVGQVLSVSSIRFNTSEFILLRLLTMTTDVNDGHEELHTEQLIRPDNYKQYDRRYDYHSLHWVS